MSSSLQANLNSYWSERAPAYDDHQRRPERIDLDRAAWGAIFDDALPPGQERCIH